MFNFNHKIIGQILFVIIFLSTSPVKSLDKFNKSNFVSEYFSGILLLNDNQYEDSLKYLKRLSSKLLMNKVLALTGLVLHLVAVWTQRQFQELQLN